MPSVRSVQSTTSAPATPRSASTMPCSCASSPASTVMSRTVRPSVRSTRSIVPIVPPASPMAGATRPSMPGRWSIRTRTVREDCAEVGGGTARPSTLPRSWTGRGRRVSAAMADAPRELFLIDGNSLAYRAFFALPESIATSDGRPTNAIFGFASMLVKILPDHGDVPTVVVWDAGLSGRKEISSEYKAQRSSRPDLLRQQWEHLAPLVEAFGYPNVSVEGYEADDVIAALAERAKGKGIPVMVVTGDRDAYQLVGDGVRIMTTSRGITDTKVYDRDGVIDRCGIPPELIPDFIGLKGDTSDNIPGVPGIGDKTAAELLQRFGDLETVLASVDQISGAKRKQNLVEHADDARLSKRLATMVRDVPVDLDLEAELTRVPDRSQIRPVFRDWELRDPLRRLEEALEAAEADAIPRPESPTARKVDVRQGAPKDLSALGEGELAIVAVAPEPAEGELLPPPGGWRFGAYAGGGYALVGEVADPAELIAAAGSRPVIGHDAKSLGAVAANLAFDTEVAAYLLDPARRGYPLDELCEERGLAVNGDDEQAA